MRGWPATLTEPDLLDAPVLLRPVRVSDVKIRRAVMEANASWLRPLSATDPDAPTRVARPNPLVTMGRRSPVLPYLSATRSRWKARRGIAFTWVVCYGGQFAGELTVWHVMWGPNRSAEVGYWIDEKLAGRGITPTALAMAADYCFQRMGLHRLEAAIQPENAASRRVVEKLGFRNEGTRIGLVHIDGAWRDHVCYAVTAEAAPGGLLHRWRNSLAASRAV
jgi:ribosomal-protein-alanine N-acetyltransferase